MRKIFQIALLYATTFLFPQLALAQLIIAETPSARGEFEVKSVSYDGFLANIHGESFVYKSYEWDKSGKKVLVYKIGRSFDQSELNPGFTAISNDGRKIIHIKQEGSKKSEAHKQVTIYQDGKLFKAYTAGEFTGCDSNKEKCNVFYDNKKYPYKRQYATYYEYKDTLSDKEKFLSKNHAFNKNDTIYLIDARKKVTLYDLNKNEFISKNISFDQIYPQIKNIESVPSKISWVNSPDIELKDVEDSRNNKKLFESISELSHLKFVPLHDSEVNKYKLYKIDLAGYLNKNGTFEIDSIHTEAPLDKDKIAAYIKSAVFKADFIPEEIDKIYFKLFFGGYRNYDDKIAEQETIKEKERQKEIAKKRLTLDKIDGVYIPKNLQECITELDRILNFENKQLLKNTEDNLEFNSHMGGLGMWIRNNWGINGGSRLSEYFHQRGIGKKPFERDEISGIIITQYQNWLKGDTKSRKQWEKEHPLLKK